MLDVEYPAIEGSLSDKCGKKASKVREVTSTNLRANTSPLLLGNQGLFPPPPIGSFLIFGYNDFSLQIDYIRNAEFICIRFKVRVNDTCLDVLANLDPKHLRVPVGKTGH